MRVGAIGGGEVEVGAKGIGVGKDPTDRVGTGGVLTRRATAHVAPKAGSSAANWPASLALWVLSGSPYAGWFQYLRPYATASVLAAVLRLRTSFVTDALSSRIMRYVSRTESPRVVR